MHKITVAKRKDISDIESLVKSVRLSTEHLDYADVWLINRNPDGRIVGCMGLERRGSNVYIQSLSVDKSCRKAE